MQTPRSGVWWLPYFKSTPDPLTEMIIDGCQEHSITFESLEVYRHVCTQAWVLRRSKKVQMYSCSISRHPWNTTAGTPTRTKWTTLSDEPSTGPYLNPNTLTVAKAYLHKPRYHTFEELSAVWKIKVIHSRHPLPLIYASCINYC